MVGAVVGGVPESLWEVLVEFKGVSGHEVGGCRAGVRGDREGFGVGAEGCPETTGDEPAGVGVGRGLGGDHEDVGGRISGVGGRRGAESERAVNGNSLCLGWGIRG